MIPRAKLDDIDEAVIQQLLGAARESRTLDFKEQLDLSDRGKERLAEDVCAFANTIGGDLVFGVTAPDGTADQIRPVAVDNLDAELLRLTNYLRDALEPNVGAALLSHPVSLAGGGHVVVLRIVASPNAPHRVRRNGKFILRNSVGNEAMDIHAIRTAFAHSEGLGERARAFRDRRLALLRERRGQVPVLPGPLLAVHVVPVMSLTRPDQHTIEELKAAAQHLLRAQPGASILGRVATNFEGVICTSNTNAQGQHYAFAQVFRDGCVELVGALVTDDRGEPPRPTLFPVQYEQALVQHGLPAALQALTALAIPAPVYLSVSLLNVHRLQVAIRTDWGFGQATLPAHLPDVVSAPVYIEDFNVAPAVMAGPALDALWNAVGIDHSQTDFGGARR